MSLRRSTRVSKLTTSESVEPTLKDVDEQQESSYFDEENISAYVAVVTSPTKFSQRSVSSNADDSTASSEETEQEDEMRARTYVNSQGMGTDLTPRTTPSPSLSPSSSPVPVVAKLPRRRRGAGEKKRGSSINSSGGGRAFTAEEERELARVRRYFNEVDRHDLLVEPGFHRDSYSTLV